MEGLESTTGVFSDQPLALWTHVRLKIFNHEDAGPRDAVSKAILDVDGPQSVVHPAALVNGIAVTARISVEFFLVDLVLGPSSDDKYSRPLDPRSTHSKNSAHSQRVHRTLSDPRGLPTFSPRTAWAYPSRWPFHPY